MSRKRENSILRIITDVNLWISYLITPRFRQRCEHLFSDKYELLFSDAFVAEFQRTVMKPELKKRLNSDEVEELRNKLRSRGTFIEVASEVTVCRDPDDNYLLALAQDGAADYLITRDEDLLSLKTFGTTEIITLYDLETMPHN
jgi:putative PIN family toxin of toxin-antitoxin system